ncbi:hypothetical protein L6Q96_15870 [Candidatus Binatia bacterium]|nr:hypothetical protein [Candidatus Binatia bacterium]
MALGIVLEETMSGWMRLDGDAEPRPFAFAIRAFTTRLLSLSAPREFRGRASLDGREVPVRGVLTIRLTGPRYELEFDHPVHGHLRAVGEKVYSAHPARLRASLVTCPLTVFRDGRRVGSAEVAYRDSILAFAFRAIRFVRAENAFEAAVAAGPT